MALLKEGESIISVGFLSTWPTEQLRFQNKTDDLINAKARQLSPKLAAWVSKDSSFVFPKLALWFSTRSSEQHVSFPPTRLSWTTWAGLPSCSLCHASRDSNDSLFSAWALILGLIQSSSHQQILPDTHPPDHSIGSPFLLLKSGWLFSTCIQSRPISECWVSTLTFIVCLLCTTLGSIYGWLLFIYFYILVYK